MRARALRRLLLLVALSALSTGRAHGQGRQTGSIAGTVLGPDGAPAVGATVTLSGASLLGGASVLRTSKDGEFRFVDLQPGTYAVLAELAPHGSTYEPELRLPVGARRSLVLQLLPESKEQVVEVVESVRAAIDPSRTSVSDTVPADFFHLLPGSRRGLDDLIALSPGTLRHRDLAQAGRPVIRGGAWTDNQILIDGINYSDLLTNSILARFDFFALDQVELLTGGLEAEYGQAAGGVVNMVTPTGGTEAELHARAAVVPSALSAGATTDRTDRYELNLRAGGPVLGDRLRHFTSLSYARELRPLQPVPGGGADQRTSDSALGFSKLSFEPADGHKLALHLSGHFERDANYELGQLRRTEAQDLFRVGGLTGHLSWKRFWQRWLLFASAGYYYFDQLNQPMSGDLETPASFDATTRVYSVNSYVDTHYRSSRLQLQGNLTHFAEGPAGAHEAKLGFDLALGFARFESAATGNEIINTSGLPCVPEQGLVEGCVSATRSGVQGPDGKLVPGASRNEPHAIQLGLYLQDSWRVGHGIHLNPGWRVDLGRIYTTDGQTLASFDGLVGPRLGASYDLGGRGETVLRGSFGRYNQTGLLALPLFFGETLRRETYRFDPATRQFDQLQSASGGNTGGHIDRSRSKETPHATELTLSLEQLLTDWLSARILGIYKRQSNLYNSLETNVVWNEAGTAIVGFKDGTPSAHYTLYTGDEFFREYAAAEVALRGQFGARLRALGSYTLSRLYGTSDLDETTSTLNVIPLVIANPRQRAFLYGPLQSDRRHVGKLALSYAVPGWGLVVGTTVTAASGTPVSRLYFNDFLGEYYNYRAPRGVDPGAPNDPSDDRARRTDPLVEWNLRVELDLARWLGGRHVVAEAQVLNLLNRRATTLPQEADVADYGSARDRQLPLRIGVGLNYHL